MEHGEAIPQEKDVVNERVALMVTVVTKVTDHDSSIPPVRLDSSPLLIDGVFLLIHL